jgi:hypothetical protein
MILFGRWRVVQFADMRGMLDFMLTAPAPVKVGLCCQVLFFFFQTFIHQYASEQVGPDNKAWSLLTVPLTCTYKILSILEPSCALAVPSTMVLHKWLADTIPNGDRILTDPAINGFIFLHPDSK